MLQPACVRSWYVPSDSRSAARRSINLATEAPLGGPGTVVRIHNISSTGMLIESSALLSVGAEFDVHLTDGGEHTARVVWTCDELCGCEFKVPLTKATISSTVLRSPPAPETEKTQTPSEAGGDSDADVVTASRGEVIESGEHKLPLQSRLRIIVLGSVFCWLPIVGLATFVLR